VGPRDSVTGGVHADGKWARASANAPAGWAAQEAAQRGPLSARARDV
jgi:hypothetical protein